MGICGSSSMTAEEKKAKDHNKKLHQRMVAEFQEEQQVHKLLLLGAGESGKSTLFKQMIAIYGEGFTEAQQKDYIPIIISNIITCAKTLAQQSAKYGPPETPEGKAATALINNDIKDNLDASIPPDVLRTLQDFWADPGIQKTYDCSASFQLTDSCKFFFDKIDVVAKADYIPDTDDVMRSRIRTTGIVENSFDIDGNKFKMFDVGGQRNERKKWIHCFENVTAVLFVAGISAYDQVLYEDENTNRMVEALKLFEEICNSRWFKQTSIILFLNKKDLFEEKLKKVPLETCFDGETVCGLFPLPLYEGDGSFADATKFVTGQFLERNEETNKEVYFHVTCATDTSNTRAVFDMVKDIIIKESLRQAGLLG